MRRLRATTPLAKLQSHPKWKTLVALHKSLKKMLPHDYR